jgi:uracil-DNA glycosylase
VNPAGGQIAVPATALDLFFRRLLVPAGPDTFNPWLEQDPGTDAVPDAAAGRLGRLKSFFSARPRWLLLGEAAGYQGAHVSGIPFTSERLMLEGAIPRIDLGGRRLSTRARPWSEPSATTVWGTLHALGRAGDTWLWNAFPWHPHRPGVLQSNRTPLPSERRAGLPVLEALLAALPGVRCFAVGRNAAASLSDLGIAATPLRHPSMGGATEFREGLRRALADETWAGSTIGT